MDESSAIPGNVVELTAALGGGLVAIAAVTAMATMADRLGLLRLSFGRLLGTILAPNAPATRAVGWGWHVLNGALLALGYREVLRRSGLAAGPMSGAGLGLAHCVVSMATLALLPRLHPRPRQAGLRPLGLCAYGPLTVPGMLLGHVVYGALVGWCLRAAARDAAARAARRPARTQSARLEDEVGRVRTPGGETRRDEG